MGGIRRIVYGCGDLAVVEDKTIELDMYILLLILFGLLAFLIVRVAFKLVSFVVAKRERVIYASLMLVVVAVGLVVHQVFFTNMSFVQSSIYTDLYLVTYPAADSAVLKQTIRDFLVSEMQDRWPAALASRADIHGGVHTFRVYEYYKNWNALLFGDSGTYYFLEHEEDLGGMFVEDLSMYQQYKLAVFEYEVCANEEYVYCGVIEYYEGGVVAGKENVFVSNGGEVYFSAPLVVADVSNLGEGSEVAEWVEAPIETSMESDLVDATIFIEAPTSPEDAVSEVGDGSVVLSPQEPDSVVEPLLESDAIESYWEACVYNQAYQETYAPDSVDTILAKAQDCYVLIDPYDSVSARNSILAMQERGNEVGCYISVGTGEVWRSDFRDLQPYLAKEEWDDWEGEYFIREVTPEVVTVMQDRIQMLSSWGCDWVEFDNMDWAQDDDWVERYDLEVSSIDASTYSATLCAYAHTLGMKCMAKSTTYGLSIFDGLTVESYRNERNWWDTKEMENVLGRGNLGLVVHYDEPSCDSVYNWYLSWYGGGLSFVCEDRLQKTYVHY